MTLLKSTLFMSLLLFSLSSCVKGPSFNKLAPGEWRAVLLLPNGDVFTEPKKNDLEYAIKPNYDELPFKFTVLNTDKEGEAIKIEIHNGQEKILVEDVEIIADSIFIRFPHYESHIEGRIEIDKINGYYIVSSKKNYRIPFRAFHGIPHRFKPAANPPDFDISGKWAVNFEVDKENPYPAIGEFVQNKNQLNGTFLTETGDYRFLEGNVNEDRISLSCFDGSHAFLFTAKRKEDGSLLGEFRSGKHYRAIWEGKKDDSVTLTDPDSLTYLNPGYDKIAFKFPNELNKMIDLEDEQYKGKAKIIQILGTWCPNCADETAFLTQYLKDNPNKNIEVIALAFERHPEFEKASKAVKLFKKRFNVPYEVLIAGVLNKKEAAKQLPMLNHILSYPTMIFIDKDDQVKRIHTGFSGPATSKYDRFKKEFETSVNDLLNE